MIYLITILLIGFLIFVHELGHLLAAWCMGIPVARFSVGFGPVLMTWRNNGTEYCLSLVPLGGYVLPKCEDEKEFFNIAVGRRIVLWLGGPAANFVFAAILLGLAHLLAVGFSWHGAFVRPWLELVRQSLALLAVLPQLFSRPDQLSGVVGIVAAGKSLMGGGLQSALNFAVLLNLNLAIFNLLPMAPLDGGKIFCALLEKIHPRLARLQTAFTLAGLAVLLALMAYTTVLDVVRQFA
ncbi:MAG: site-2 protease family protein [Planctomycetia bacterium]|nr:site-2 protease family protein [Planctomycetia bacterium]